LNHCQHSVDNNAVVNTFLMRTLRIH